MSKPEDIPQDVWDAARTAMRLSRKASPIEATAIIARAIMSAEKRGEEREREACGLVADRLPIGGLIQTNETDLKRLWKWSGSAQAGAIAAAIRKRSNP